MLDELESIFNVALVCGEKKTTSVDRPPRRMLGRGNFGAELNTAPNDTTIVGGCFDWWIFEIRSRVGLSSMRCEGASVLCCWIVGKVVTEIVVLFLVMRDSKVVFEGGEIDGCSCARLLGLDYEAIFGISGRGFIPLIQRPIRRAPRSSLPWSGSKPGIGFLFKKLWNSGTSWKR